MSFGKNAKLSHLKRHLWSALPSGIFGSTTSPSPLISPILFSIPSSDKVVSATWFPSLTETANSPIHMVVASNTTSPNDAFILLRFVGLLFWPPFAGFTAMVWKRTKSPSSIVVSLLFFFASVRWFFFLLSVLYGILGFWTPIKKKEFRPVSIVWTYYPPVA